MTALMEAYKEQVRKIGKRAINDLGEKEANGLVDVSPAVLQSAGTTTEVYTAGDVLDGLRAVIRHADPVTELAMRAQSVPSSRALYLYLRMTELYGQGPLRLDIVRPGYRRLSRTSIKFDNTNQSGGGLSVAQLEQINILPAPGNRISELFIQARGVYQPERSSRDSLVLSSIVFWGGTQFTDRFSQSFKLLALLSEAEENASLTVKDRIARMLRLYRHRSYHDLVSRVIRNDMRTGVEIGDSSVQVIKNAVIYDYDPLRSCWLPAQGCPRTPLLCGHELPGAINDPNNIILTPFGSTRTNYSLPPSFRETARRPLKPSVIRFPGVITPSDICP